MPYWVVTRDSNNRTGLLTHPFETQSRAEDKSQELEINSDTPCSSKVVYYESSDYRTVRQELAYKEYGIDESHKNAKRLIVIIIQFLKVKGILLILFLILLGYRWSCCSRR